MIIVDSHDRATVFNQGHYDYLRSLAKDMSTATLRGLVEFAGSPEGVAALRDELKSR